MRFSEMNDDELVAWLTDSDYEPYRRNIYADRQTGEWIVIYEDDEQADAEGMSDSEENAADRAMVEATPDRYVAVPVPDHDRTHEHFAVWLQQIGWNDGEGYPSIGRWMERFGGMEARRDFNDFRRRCAVRDVVQFQMDHGLTITDGKVVSAGRRTV